MTRIGNYWRKNLKQEIFDIPKKRDDLFGRCLNIPDRKGEQQREVSLMADYCQ